MPLPSPTPTSPPPSPVDTATSYVPSESAAGEEDPGASIDLIQKQADEEVSKDSQADPLPPGAPARPT